MKKQIFSAIQNHFVAILGLAVIFILIFLFILPGEKEIDKIKNKTENLKRQVQQKQNTVEILEKRLLTLKKEQKKQKRKLKELKTEFTSLQTKGPEIGTFTLPELNSFPDTLSSLPRTIHNIARKHQLENIAVRLLEQKTLQDAKTIAASVTGSSALSRIRAFIVTLLETPYVHSITQLQIERCKDTMCLDVTFSVLI